MTPFLAEEDPATAADLSPRLIERRDGPVVWLAMHNPARLNALTVEMFETLDRRLSALAAESDLRVLVLCGATRRAFSTGGDMSEFATRRQSDAQVVKYRAMVRRVNETLLTFPKPTIAVVSGHCLAAGLGLALACDIRLASPEARFGITSARIGGGYDLNMIARLVRLVGPSRAGQMLYSALPMDGDQAAAAGLANTCHPVQALPDAVREMAATMAANAPLSIAAFKQAIAHLAEGRGAEDEVRAALAACALSADHREGRRAFAEKRPPRFQGA